MTTKEFILQRLHEEVNGTESKYYTEEELSVWAETMVNHWDENTSGWVIAEAFVDDHWDNDKPCRRCSECGALMIEGYCFDQGQAYYCNDECLNMAFTPSEWETECAENDQSYYTEWR